MILQYQNEKYHKTTILFQQKQQEAQDETNKILSLLLPKFILTDIDSGITDIELNQGEVVVFFAEITNFEQIAAKQTRHIVSFLDEVYRHFDKLCIAKEATKIETVGKVYMASFGLKFKQQKKKKIDKPLASIELAFDFLNLTNEAYFGRDDLRQKIQIRIGIHVGTVLAGVIGFHKPQFSLIGDTVNTTSRLCSNSESGEILISDQLYDQLKNTKYLFTSRLISAKGKGNLTVYRVMTRNGSISKRYKPHKLNKMKTLNLNNGKSHRQFRNISYLQQMTIASKHCLEPIKRKQRSKSDIVKRTTQLQAVDRFHNPEVDQIERNPIDCFIIQKTKRSSFFLERQKTLTQSWRKTYSQKERLNQLLYGDLKKNYLEDDNQRLYLDELTLQFTKQSDKLMVDNFHIHKNDENYLSQVMMIGILLLFWQSRTFFLFFSNNDPYPLFYCKVIINSIILVYILTNRLVSNKFNSQQSFKNFKLIFFLFISLIKLVLSASLQKDDILLHLDLLEQIQWFDIQTSYIGLSFLENLLTIGCPIACWLIILMVRKIYHSTFLVIFSLILFLYKAYNKRINDVYQFMLTNHLQAKKFYKDTLIQNLLPNHILTRFYADNTLKYQLSDHLEEVTVLFADIAGFTAYSAQVQSEQVVNMLRSLFTEFDKECFENNVYKVYTIGDCYVILGMNDLNSRKPAEEARNVLVVAFKMLEIIQIVRNNVNYHGLHMRIGIHTGECLGGVIGTDVVRYDIYGQDVTIANKMESYGTEDKINVSETTKGLLEYFYPQEFRFEFNKENNFSQYDRNVKSYFAFQNKII